VGASIARVLETLMPTLTLADVLAELPDPRSHHGRFHPLPAVMNLVVLGLLLGRKSLSAIARLGRTYGTPLAQALGFRRGKTPAKSTLSEILRAVDAQALEDALTRWVISRLPADLVQLSLDGKTLKGSRDGELPGQHLLSAYAPQVQAVLAQMRVEATTNEHKAALRLLGLLPLAGKVVLGDAIFCQRDLAGQIVGQSGDYVFVVKDNQPGLGTDVAAGFGFEEAARSMAAAFPPRGSAAAAGADGDDGGQGAWSLGEADAADDRNSDAAPEVAGAGPGL
jgi:DDE_Tnp_1-associated/Transposase DDE domain